MTRETAAALMNWGRAPTTVSIFRASGNLSEGLVERDDDPVLFFFAQIGPHGQAEHLPCGLFSHGRRPATADAKIGRLPI